eukprot:3962514-Alexandrium_andersonii.AAC.1
MLACGACWEWLQSLVAHIAGYRNYALNTGWRRDHSFHSARAGAALASGRTAWRGRDLSVVSLLEGAP